MNTGKPILPGSGRWQREALTKGGIVLARTSLRGERPLHHRFAAVPLPVPGRIALAAIVAMAVAVTPAHARKAPKPSGFEAMLPVPAPVAPVANGGIFNVAAGYAPLYQGMRASRVGDPVTIVLVETTTASKSVNSKSSKNGSASINPPTTGLISKLFKSSDLNASSDSSFNGQGSAAQTSALSSTLSVTIAEVRANGTALVRGEKKMLVSQGDEWVRFSGIVRLADIDEDNAILSTRVADARIEYTGKGALQRASKQGWLGRFFNMISPF